MIIVSSHKILGSTVKSIGFIRQSLYALSKTF